MPDKCVETEEKRDKSTGSASEKNLDAAAGPAVTVVIPAYNHEDYLGAAIESVVNQTFKNWELIVIDDGSTDSTPEVARGYSDIDNVTVLKHENRGLSATLNRGLSLARGRYFGFLPSDDEFEPLKLALQVEWLDKMPHVAALSTFQSLIDKNGNAIEDRAMEEWFSFEPQSRSDLVLTLLERNFIPAPSVLVRTQILKAMGGFDTRCVYMQDYELWLRIVKQHTISVLPRPLIKYRWHGGNQTYSATPDTENERAWVLEKAVSNLRAEEIFPELSGDTTPGHIVSCLNTVKDRLRKNPPPNLYDLDRMADEMFGALLKQSSDVIPDQRAVADTPETPLDVGEKTLSILFEVTHLDRGGLEQVVHDLAIRLAARRHCIVVVCTESGGMLAKRLAEVDGINVEVLPQTGKSDAFIKILAQYRVDVVSAHYSTFGAGIARRESVPVISVLHNIYTWLPRDIESDFRGSDPHVSCYVAVSDDAADFAVKNLNVDKSKIAVIPNGLDVAAWQGRVGKKGDVRKSAGFSESDYLFLCVGSIYRVKGQDRIVRSFPEVIKQHPRARAILLGSVVDPPFYQWIKELIARHDLEDVVKIVDFTVEPEQFYNESDAFVLPSFIEGWSISLMEAMYCGLPFIMPGIGGAAAMVEESQAGIVIPTPFKRISDLDLAGIERFTMMKEDPLIQPLSNAMGDFCANPEKWAAAGENGRRLVEKNYTIETTVDAHEKLCLETVFAYRHLMRTRCRELANTVDSLTGITNYLAQNTRLQRLLEKSDSRIDEQQVKIANLKQQRNDLSQRLNDSEQLVYQYSAEAEGLKAALNDMYNSASWKITSPLRNFSRSFPFAVPALRRSKDLLINRGPLSFIRSVVRMLRRGGMMNTGQYQVLDEPMDLFHDIPPEKCARLSDLTVILMAGVPYDDIGGGQRSAQLARVLTARGIPVFYVYAYPKVDVATGRPKESAVRRPLLNHVYVEHTDPQSLFASFSGDAVAIFELPHPKFRPFLDKALRDDIVSFFDLIDQWDSSLGEAWFDEGVYRYFIKNSSKVAASARALENELRSNSRDDALYIPNAADEKIFDKYRKYPVPGDMKSLKGASFVYFGSLYGDWFDWECIERVAKQSSDFAVYLIGEKPDAVTMPPNVFFLGPKPISQLPAYLAHCDAALLPFKPGKISDAVSPIKIFEYLFMDVPVVAAAIPEVVGMPGVYTASYPKEFAELCTGVVRRGRIETSENNDRFIAENSWLARADAFLPSRGNKNVSAVILIRNNRAIIGRCLETLFLHGRDFVKEIIVVDNASTDKGGEYVEEHFPDVSVIRNKVNGCSSGRNLGVAAASGEYLAFFDSDQWFTSRSFFEEALWILKNNREVGAVGWAAGWFEKGNRDLGGIIVDHLPGRGISREICLKGFRTDIGHIGTGGMFISKKVFEKTEGFDETLDPTCFEDTDISFQIKALGWEIAFRDFGGIRHQPHQTTNITSSTYRDIFRRNAEYIKRKWRHRPEFFVDYPSE